MKPAKMMPMMPVPGGPRGQHALHHHLVARRVEDEESEGRQHDGRKRGDRVVAAGGRDGSGRDWPVSMAVQPPGIFAKAMKNSVIPPPSSITHCRASVHMTDDSPPLAV